MQISASAKDDRVKNRLPGNAVDSFPGNSHVLTLPVLVKNPTVEQAICIPAGAHPRIQSPRSTSRPGMGEGVRGRRAPESGFSRQKQYIGLMYGKWGQERSWTDWGHEYQLLSWLRQSNKFRNFCDTVWLVLVILDNGAVENGHVFNKSSLGSAMSFVERPVKLFN